jgi:5'-AMP-activated protein kinase, catalytic alpha subunit
MEVARAIKEAASATPPAFSPGGSRGTTPGGSHYGGNRYSSGGSHDGRQYGVSYSSTSMSPSATAHSGAPSNQGRLAEEAARALMHPGGGHYQSSGQQTPSPAGPGGPPVVQMTSSIPGNTGMIAQHQHGRRTRRWYLGIQSKKDPAHVMNEVYKALMALGCEWLQLSSYRIKCKWRPNVTRGGFRATATGTFSMMPAAGGETPQAAWNKSESDGSMDEAMEVDAKERKNSTQTRMKIIAGDDGHLARVPNLSMLDYSIKIGLTLYKVQQNIYLLDFQKVSGDAFSFMTLCANIITELKTLSAASKQAQQALLAQQQATAQQHSMQSGRYQPQGMSK